MILGDITVYERADVTGPDAKGNTTRRPGGRAVMLAAGDYDLSDLRARDVGNDWISWITIPTNQMAILFSDEHFQGQRQIVGSGNYDLERVPQGGVYWNDKISSLIVVNKTDVPSLTMATAAWFAFWDARTEQARTIVAQREAARQQAAAVREQAAAIAAARAQADAQTAALQAQVDAARQAAEIQRAIAAQSERDRTVAAQRATADAALATARAEAETFAREQAARTTERTALVMAPPAVTPARKSNTLFLVGGLAAAVYFYSTRNRS